MAIPSLFMPIQRDSFLLVDGGVINNFPADRLIEMGADIVIGVDVGFQKPQKSDRYDIFKIFEQTIFITSENRNNQNRASCDILITPDMTGLSASNFSDADSFVVRGEKAARSLFTSLKALSDSLKGFKDLSGNKKLLIPVDSVYLKEIQILGLKNASARLLTGKMGLDMMTWITPGDIETAINNAYSSLYFTKVTYEVQKIEKDKPPGSVRLIIQVTENQPVVVHDHFFAVCVLCFCNQWLNISA
jgi:NTE family protein